MNKKLEKKESLLVLLAISFFSLGVVLFSIRGVNLAQDLTLQANMGSLQTRLMEYYLEKGFFPKAETCNLKEDCSSFKKEIDIFVYQEIFYKSNGQDYFLYSPSFSNRKIYFVMGSDFLLKELIEVPEL